ncbi:TniQ family protein [Paracoccus ravus]|uniref:TniQ family protein n=1 Tax=Paracoccus ravus TaxID=2447760 RepID=UPI0014306995|nr:TniQ family protein [Paracoccus ravus]
MKLVTTPLPEESLDGFLRRHAEAEFRDEVGDLLRGVGFDFGRPLIERASELEQLLDLPAGTLDPMLPRASSKIPGLTWGFQRRHSAPVCPECLASGNPRHQAWQHCFATACPEHALVLVDFCPICAETMQPGHGGHATCRCGHYLTHCRREAASDWEVAVSALIAGQMHPSRGSLPPSLTFQTPSDISSFLLFLIASQTAPVTGKHGKIVLPKTVEQARGQLRSIEPLLSNWPEAFEQDVSLRLRQSDQEKASAPARLGKWYQRFMRFRHPAYRVFHQAFEQVVRQEFDGRYFGAPQASRSVDRRWISAAEAGRRIGIRAGRIVEAVAAGAIAGRTFTSGFGHRHTTIDLETVESIITNRQRFIDKTHARDFLGISRKQYDLLAEADIFAASLPKELPPLVDGPHDFDALEAMVAGIAKNATPVPGKTIALQDLNLRYTTDRSGLTSVFQAIAEGALPPCPHSISGAFGKFRFPLEEVQMLLGKARRGTGLTVQELARQTGWKEQCISGWCQQGLIEHETTEHAGGLKRVINTAALARFQMAYVPVSVLAQQADTSSRSMLKKLAGKEIQTTGATQDGTAWRGHLVAMPDLAKLI